MALSHTIWDDKTDKFIRTLNLWKMRNLSLKGKNGNQYFSSSVPLVPSLRISHTGLSNPKTQRRAMDFSLVKQKGPSQTRHCHVAV